MANINDPIRYDWKLGWREMGSPYPKVTRLLKAVIEKDVEAMNYLAARGASLKASDEPTLQRIIFHVIDSYPVMKWLVDHGMSRMGRDIDVNGNNGINDNCCIRPSGHFVSVTALAYHIKAYDVMDLLCAHGFDELDYYDPKGVEYCVDKEIFKNGDKEGRRILLENGYTYEQLRSHYDYYAGISYCNEYILDQPQVKRKTVGLDPMKFRGKIPAPEYEKVPLIFGRKGAQRRNQRRREDHQDRVRAYSQFVFSFGKQNMINYVREREELEKINLEFMVETSKEIHKW